jgi:alpha-ketoglutarate-dependent taurine dioxygenase
VAVCPPFFWPYPYLP